MKLVNTIRENPVSYTHLDVYKRQTPNNVNVQGKITEDTEGKDIHDNNDINIEW